ncbi:MAG: OPT/YSL family transporter, partial [Myxococcota bacterium]
IGGRELSAPQATLFAKLAQGFFGEGTLPLGMVALGTVLGLVLVVADRALERSRLPLRAHAMPVAVGIYLPFGIAVPILVGGLLSFAVGRGATDRAERDARSQRGVLFSSGVIAGEALTGVLVALLAVVGVSRLELGGEHVQLASVVGAALLLGLFIDFTSPRR